MTAHIHAEAMLQYAQDALETDKPWERWQSDIDVDGNGDYVWANLCTHPTWYPSRKYRRKPRTININGHEVPEPLREAPEYERSYYIPNIANLYLSSHSVWRNNDYDFEMLRRRMLHLTESGAIAHAKALLSFTAKPEANNE